jgi:leucyl aminopeptidase
MELKFTKITSPKHGAIIIGVTEEHHKTARFTEYDALTGGALTRAVTVRGFKGKKGEHLVLLAPHGIEADALIITGLGKEKELDILKLQNVGGLLVPKLNMLRIKKAAILVETIHGVDFTEDEIAANIAFGARLRSYRFDKYRTKEKDEDKPTLKTLSLMLQSNAEAEAHYDKLEKIADGIFLARDVVTEPPNVIYPESYAKRCKELEKLGIEVEILDVKDMQKLGMGALLGVGQGSSRDSRLVVMRWNGAKNKEAQPLAFIGKGVTFDTGGISLKPATGMEDMKYDMGGSAVVVGLLKALAGRKAKVNVVGVIGLVENMPDGNAQRPSDVVTSMSGQTIEVLNTDAEGRLVLADALWYCQDRFKP